MTGYGHRHQGYEPDGILTFQVRVPSEARMQRGRLTRFYGDLVERLGAVRGVVAVGVASKLPLHADAMTGTLIVEGQPRPAESAERERVGLYFVPADYHRALGTRLLAGRTFEDRDFQTASRVALADESLARTQFGADAIGKRATAMGARPWTVIGVVETVKFGAVSDAGQPIMYFPATPEFEGLALNRLGGGVIVRTTQDPAALVPIARQFVKELDPAPPMFNELIPFSSYTPGWKWWYCPQSCASSRLP